MSVNSIMAFGRKSWDTWFPTRWDENLNDFRFAFCKALDENEKQRLGWPPVNNNTYAGGILIHPKTSTPPYDLGGISFNNGTPVYTGICGTATSTNGYMYAVNDSTWLNCPTLAITKAVTAYRTMSAPKYADNFMSTYDNLILQVDELTEDTSGQTCPNLWGRGNMLTAHDTIDTIGGAYDRGPQNITKVLNGTDWDKKAVEATFGIFLRSNIDIFTNSVDMVIVTLGYRNDVVSQNWHYASGCKHKFSAVHPVTGEQYYYGYYLDNLRNLYEPSFTPFQMCRYAFPYVRLPYLTDQQKSTLQLKVLDFFLRIF